MPMALDADLGTAGQGYVPRASGATWSQAASSSVLVLTSSLSIVHASWRALITGGSESSMFPYCSMDWRMATSTSYSGHVELQVSDQSESSSLLKQDAICVAKQNG